MNLDGFGSTNLSFFGVTNFEVIDLSGGTNDLLTFSSTQINGLTDSVIGAQKVVRIDGDTGDSIASSDGGWGTSTGTTTIGVNSYTIYEHTDGVTKILVESIIDQTGLTPV